MKILLFAGQAQHGKDTSAMILKGYHEKMGQKCMIIRYGDYLKFISREYYGWDGKKDEAGRTLLQQVGTEKARVNNPDIWVNVVIEFIKAFGKAYNYILIPDFRYPNEHIRLIENGFDTTTFWIHRKDFDNGLTPEQKNHLSEISLLDYPFDHVISVESKIYKLKDALMNAVE